MMTAADDPSTSQNRIGAQPGPNGAGAGRPTEATVVAELRRELRAERERSLNSTDRVLGAQAEAAQARAEIKELQYRLHVREAELAQVNELLAERGPDAALGARTARAVADRAGIALRQLAERSRTP